MAARLIPAKDTFGASRSAAFSISKNGAGLKPPKSRHDVRRELLGHHVEVAHRAVVVAARDLDLVLDVGQFLLQ